MTISAFTPTVTPEQIAAAKAKYDDALTAQAAAKKIVDDIKANSAATIDAYEAAKAAVQALKPNAELAKGRLMVSDAEVNLARQAYATLDPKALAAEESAAKGASNAELLAYVQAFLVTKPGGASNSDIYDAITTAGATMAGVNKRGNLTSYLSRWGAAGVLAKTEAGWGLVAPAAPAANPFSTPLAPAAPVSPFPPVAPIDQTPANPFVAPVEQAPVVEQPAVNPDVLGDDFPGILVLRENGVTTKTQLAGVTKEQLTSISGIGDKRAEQILAALAG